MVFAGVSMYYLARQFWGEAGGIISALYYTYSPYHALNLYVRGAVAELFAFAFIPLAFYGLWKVYKTQKMVLCCGRESWVCRSNYFS